MSLLPIFVISQADMSDITTRLQEFILKYNRFEFDGIVYCVIANNLQRVRLYVNYDTLKFSSVGLFRPTVTIGLALIGRYDHVA